MVWTCVACGGARRPLRSRKADLVTVAPILLLDNRDSFVWNLAQAFQ